MPLNGDRPWSRDLVATADELLPGPEVADFQRRGQRRAIRPGCTVTPTGANSASFATSAGPFAAACDRIRLTADGKIRNCLFANRETDLKPILRGGADDKELAGAIAADVAVKWAGHLINRPGFVQPERAMHANRRVAWMQLPDDLPVEDARRLLISWAQPGRPVLAPLEQAVGRVLAEPVTARGPLPLFDNSAVDGYALISADTLTAERRSPALLRVTGEAAAGAGELPTVEPGTAARVYTGAPIPPGADAVVRRSGSGRRMRAGSRSAGPSPWGTESAAAAAN